MSLINILSSAESTVIEVPSEAAKIALKITQGISITELQEIISILSKPKEFQQVVREANNELLDSYKKSVEDLYDEKNISPNEPYYKEQFNNDLKECLNLGFTRINNMLGIGNDQGELANKSAILAGKNHPEPRAIEKKKTWEQIKKDLE